MEGSAGGNYIANDSAYDGLIRAPTGISFSADAGTTLSMRISAIGAVSHTDSANTSAFPFETFISNAATCGSITRVGTTAVVTYNTTSDYRIKDLYGEFKLAAETLRNLSVHDGKFKGDIYRKPMLVAHEVQKVTPWAVTGKKDAVDDDGKPILQQLATGTHEALLIAGWQELDARISKLEAQNQRPKRKVTK